ncbi:MAG: hypothetical protein PHU61_02255 [Candidatus Absconditabacteria bacterium]|nr:hypothetical protein [Candidatus Absconditabacteria bacterium]MDD3868505.1 hypothetical protein [Candidatus Absconditabacteria bacterium]MDD4713899.1 hypothetical protein [Candidatus Absconditabacteria bacterium]
MENSNTENSSTENNNTENNAEIIGNLAAAPAEELLDFFSNEKNIELFLKKEAMKGGIKKKVVEIPENISNRLKDIVNIKKDITWTPEFLKLVCTNKLKQTLEETTQAPENYGGKVEEFINKQTREREEGIISKEIIEDKHYLIHTIEDNNRRKGNSRAEMLKVIFGYYTATFEEKTTQEGKDIQEIKTLQRAFTAKGKTRAERILINQRYLPLSPEELEKYPDILDVILHGKKQKGYTYDQKKILVAEIMNNPEEFKNKLFNNKESIPIDLGKIWDEILERFKILLCDHRLEGEFKQRSMNAILKKTEKYINNISEKEKNTFKAECKRWLEAERGERHGDKEGNKRSEEEYSKKEEHKKVKRPDIREILTTTTSNVSDKIVRFPGSKEGESFYSRIKRMPYKHEGKHKQKYVGDYLTIEIFPNKESLANDLGKSITATENRIKNIQSDILRINTLSSKIKQAKKDNDWDEILDNLGQYFKGRTDAFAQNMNAILKNTLDKKNIHLGNIEEQIKSAQQKGEENLIENTITLAYLKDFQRTILHNQDW